MMKENTINMAEEMAEEGWLCSESVFKAIASAQGITGEFIPKVATGLAAGIGRSGEVCGAVSGAIMGLGLKYGRSSVEETTPGKRPYWYATELLQLIRERHGTATCAGILGLDLMDPGDLKTYNELDHWNTTCRELIKEATALAWEILQKGP